MTAVLELLSSLLQPLSLLETANPNADPRAVALLQPLVVCLARLFTVPRAAPAAADGPAAQSSAPLFPVFLSSLSASSPASASRLLTALLTLLYSCLLHLVTLPALLKILSGLLQLTSSYPSLALLLPPILHRVGSGPLVQHPTVPVTAAPNAHLMSLLASLWHPLLASVDSSTASASLSLMSSVPHFWQFTLLLSNSPFASHVPSMMPAAQQEALLTAMTDYSTRVQSEADSGVEGESSSGRAALLHSQSELMRHRPEQQSNGYQSKEWPPATNGLTAMESDEGIALVRVDEHSERRSDEEELMASTLAALESMRRSRQAMMSLVRDGSRLGDEERLRVRALIEAERAEWLQLQM